MVLKAFCPSAEPTVLSQHLVPSTFLAPLGSTNESASHWNVLPLPGKVK